MNDLRFAFRQLQKNPGFTAVAVLTLALGIGANIAIFGLVNGLLLKRPAVRAPDELAAIYAAQGNGDINAFVPPASTFLQLGGRTTQFGVRMATPVPEPATTAVMTAAGLAAFACLRRRWKAA